MEVEETSRNGSENNQKDLPVRIDIMRLAAARVQEIQALTQAIEDPQRTGLVFQKLPRHMRRRAMSRNPKRLPARLREAHVQQMAKGGPQPESKRPSRKYRRRPSNLLSEYNRRQRTHVWLETHIWHAKRFHMTKNWGYHLALSPNDRSFRACYRASTSHCLLQDVSYICCLQLCGKQSDLLEGLSKHANTACGLTFAARALLPGGREGFLVFFAPNSYPQGAVGPVSFLWRPLSERAASDPVRTLWIWCHPSYYTEIVSHLTQTFGLRPGDSEDLIGGNLVSDRGVNLTLMKDKLNRFRLSGPLSHAVLQQSLHIIKDATGTHNDLWEKVSGAWSPGLFSAGTVLSLAVVDPRLNLPSKRTKAETPQNDGWSIPIISDDISPLDSLLWDNEHRKSVSKAKVSEARLNAERSELLVPGSSLPETLSPSIPILLIQRPGNKDGGAARIGLGCGWDVVLPSGWAMPFWIAFIFRGGRSCGIREANALAFECGKNSILCPDTAAGRAEEDAHEKALKEKHFRLPPDKRANFRKLGVSSPFRCPWPELVRDWDGKNAAPEHISVLRDVQKINNLRESLSKISGAVGNKDEAQKLFSLCEWNLDVAGCLVAVRVELIRRGLVADLSSICVPSAEDIRALANEKTINPEALHVDSNQEERRSVRWKHEKLLKKLRRARVREKREKSENDDEPIPRASEAPTKNIVEEHALKMQNMWLPDVSRVKDVSSRVTMGFLTKGDFCLSNGSSRGVGYVTMSSLKYLAQTWVTSEYVSEKLRKLLRKNNDSHLMVLVRSPHSQHYWPAHLHVCLDFRH